MLKMRQIVGSIHSKVDKILFMLIFCFAVVSMVATKPVFRPVSSIEEEALVDFALDHNQCLGEGHPPSTFGYNQCMENLQIQRKSVISI